MQAGNRGYNLPAEAQKIRFEARHHPNGMWLNMNYYLNRQRATSQILSNEYP
jgi:hypothetical protein